MIKPSLVISTLLLFSASIAHAATTPAEPGAQGAASVQKNLDANKSKGQADKGLTNAEARITAEHGKAKGHEEKNESKKERSEKPEHPMQHERVERPAKPERPGR
jgi:hypothetical protein